MSVVDEREPLGVAGVIVYSAGEPVAVEVSLSGVHARRENSHNCQKEETHWCHAK